MPTNLVKTKKDEKLWKMAQKRASSQYDVEKDKDQYWAITTGIYKRMKGQSKKAEITAKLDKSDFLKLARSVALEYFNNEDNNLTDIVVKTALIKDMNDDQIQMLCSTSNHVVHAAIQKEKAAEEDQSVEFEIARPEDAVDKIADLCEAPDDVYMDSTAIFLQREPEEKEAEEDNYGEALQKTVREGQILRQNIRNIATASNKMANELAIEEDKTDEAIEKLYSLVRRYVENGKDLSILQGALSKAFDNQQNFAVIWNDIEERLTADGLITREHDDNDRGENFSEIENWSPNYHFPIMAVASEISRRTTKAHKLNLTIEGLGNMVKGAQDALEENIITEKKAVLPGAVMKGIASWGKKTVAKKGSKAVVKGAIKNKSKFRKGLIPVGFGTVDYATAAGPKLTVIGGR